MKYLFRKPFVFLSASLFFGYLVLVYFLSDFGNTFRTVLLYTDTLNWPKFSMSILLTLIIASLVAINGTTAYRQYRLRKECREGSVLAGAGTLGGLALGVCPLCVGGILPIILGALGVSFSFGTLPLQGIEIQILVIVILLISLWWMKKKN
jgi:hypothetical protein